MRKPWKSKTVLLASREGCKRTERERAWEDLVIGRDGTTPPNPPSQGGKKGTPSLRKGLKEGATQVGMKCSLCKINFHQPRVKPTDPIDA